MLSRSRVAKTMVCKLLVAVAAAIAAVATGADAAHGEETYYSIRIVDLKVTEGKLPNAADYAGWWMPWTPAPSFRPYATLDGEGEAYVGSVMTGEPPVRQNRSKIIDQEILTMRLPAPRKVTGSLFWPKADYSGMEKLRFVIESKPQVDFHDAKLAFTDAKQSHYLDLMNRNLPGAAWFRHQSRQVKPGVTLPTNTTTSISRVGHLDETFDLFGGGKAVSENLQLDRALPPVVANEDFVPLDKIDGLNVAEIDWKPLLKAIAADGTEAKSDTLAKLVPADQHVALFPSFQAFVQVADRLAEHGTIILRLAEVRTKDEQLATRYERQLGVSIDGLGRIVGPRVIGSVAVTGSDPYFESGTDVALVFETSHPAILKNLLLAQIGVQARQTPGARPIAGEVGGLSYSGMRSDDRAVSSYVTVLPGAVLLTNSPYQVERFAAVANKREPAIASLDEFTFFRNRYPLGDKQESALVFLSDATIRRWCGPRWRIAASRELRDAAVLSELQAKYMDGIVKKQIEAGPLHTDFPLMTGNTLTLTADGPRSSTLGDLAFMTPIAELKFDQVTKAEAEAYKTWREGYQRNWRWAFDPIALRLSVAENRLSADLTVMPLIANSEYRQFMAISRGATILPDAGDPHDSLAQLILAIDVGNGTVQFVGNFASALWAPNTKFDPFGWIGQSVSITVDRDPFWEEMAKCETESDREKFAEQNVGRYPVGVWVEVSSGVKLAEFLAELRKYDEQTEPGERRWEDQEYRGEPYIKITPTARARSQHSVFGGFVPQLFFVASGKFFFVTPSEAVLKRFLDRQVALQPAEKDADKTAATSAAADQPADVKPSAEPKSPGDGERGPQPWLGSNVGLQVDRMLLPLLAAAYGREYQAWMQSQSWNNLPILNEWRRLYPDMDPLDVHDRVWHEKLVCPGGGAYVWNDEWQTMESTVYGHPGQPETGPNAPPGLLDFSFANFGLTFEEHGLRARVSLDRELPRQKAAADGR